jgi:hypothetical protein
MRAISATRLSLWQVPNRRPLPSDLSPPNANSSTQKSAHYCPRPCRTGPGLGHTRPGARSASLGAGDARPGVTDSRPGVMGSRPGARDSRPGARDSRPGAMHSRPGVTHSRLGVTQTGSRGPARRLICHDPGLVCLERGFRPMVREPECVAPGREYHGPGLVSVGPGQECLDPSQECVDPSQVRGRRDLGAVAAAAGGMRVTGCGGRS